MITTTSRLLLQLLHERGIALRSSFLFLSACSVVHLLRTFFLLPRKLIPYPLPDNYTYGYESTSDESALQIQSVILEKWQRTIRRGGMHSFNRWECWIESTWMQKKCDWVNQKCYVVHFCLSFMQGPVSSHLHTNVFGKCQMYLAAWLLK